MTVFAENDILMALFFLQTEPPGDVNLVVAVWPAAMVRVELHENCKWKSREGRNYLCHLCILEDSKF